MKKFLILISFFLLFLSCQKEEEIKKIKIPPSVPAKLAVNLPNPILTDHAYLLEIYWKAWELLQQNIKTGNPQNNFIDAYLDEGFNDLIYQWDTCFMALFAMYGRILYPAMASLDNFYMKQRSDGWICRVYQESDGKAPSLPSDEEPMINPPLFAFVEWKYFLLTGDNSRLNRVIRILDKYYNWIDQNTQARLAAKGLYYNTLHGSGMDNSPRDDINNGGWIDLSSQMSLFAKYMMFMAKEIGDDSLQQVYENRYRLLVRLINGKMWDEKTHFYYDIDVFGEKKFTKTAAAFWTLLSEVATFPQARQLAEHLMNPDEFYRDHLFPSLAADHPQYVGEGHYWRGGVWAPINYMIIKGLDIYPLRELAANAALNHVKNIYQVYKNFKPSANQIVPEEIDDNYQTIWECYAPDYPQPSTRWDGKYLSRQDFVGWSGLGPIALLLENIIGLQPSAPRNVLYWNLRLKEQHGVHNYQFGGNQIDIVCLKNELPVGHAEIRIQSNKDFTLIVSSQVGVKEFEIKKGENHFEIKI